MERGAYIIFICMTFISLLNSRKFKQYYAFVLFVFGSLYLDIKFVFGHQIFLYLELVLNQMCHGNNELDDALESQ